MSFVSRNKSVISTNEDNQQVVDEVTSFSQEPVSIDKAILEKKIKKTLLKETPVRIIIPAVAIDLPVKEAKIVNGYWEVFKDRAGFGLGSAYPDEIGNQVIFAHAKEGLFLPLRKVQAGQRVFILTNSKWFSYTITDIKEVLPSQKEVIVASSEPILTIYTCSGYADSKRLIVTAKRI